jgi:Papain family cysteine protease
MPPKKKVLLSAELKKKKASWQAKETPHSLFTEAQKLALLGAVPDKKFLKSVSEKAQKAAKAMKAMPPSAIAEANPPVVDWRNKGGNFITPIKDQAHCGSCVSFATVALIESTALITQGVTLDLSEADSHFCSNHGANCNGWWPNNALDEAKGRGICDEPGFPYATAFPGNNPRCSTGGNPGYCNITCRVAPDRSNRVVKIANWTSVVPRTDRKTYLANVGPMTACFDVYDDFFSYSTGVYHHVTGPYIGGHCVLIIGYSDIEQCWICKNSWGSGWGNGGFFKIRYGDCNIDNEGVLGIGANPFYGCSGVSIPHHGFQVLGGVLISNLAVGKNKDGRLEVFGRGTDNAIWHMWQTAPNNGWSGWASLGGNFTGDPVVASNADGRLEVFCRDNTNTLKHIWQLLPNSGWGAWQALGTITGNPAVGKNRDGRLEVFARNINGLLTHIWQVAPNSSWSPWQNFACQMLGSPAVGSNKDGRLEVFFRGPASQVLHLWQVTPGGGWSSWASLGGVILRDPVVGSNLDGRLEVFAIGTDNGLWHIWQLAPNSAWGGWATLGGVLTSQVCAANNKDGRLEVFGRGTDSAVWHIWQVAPGAGWTGWSSLGGQTTGDPAVGSNADGRLEVFDRNLGNQLIHTWQTTPNGGWN